MPDASVSAPTSSRPCHNISLRPAQSIETAAIRPNSLPSNPISADAPLRQFPTAPAPSRKTQNFVPCQIQKFQYGRTCRGIMMAGARAGKQILNATERTNHLIPFHPEFFVWIFPPLPPAFWIVWLQKNKGDILFAAPESVRQKQFSRQEIPPIYSEALQAF